VVDIQSYRNKQTIPQLESLRFKIIYLIMEALMREKLLKTLLYNPHYLHSDLL